MLRSVDVLSLGSRAVRRRPRGSRAVLPGVTHVDITPSCESRVAAMVLHSTVRVWGPAALMSPALPLARIALDTAADVTTPRRFKRGRISTRFDRGWVRGEWDCGLPEPGEPIIYYLHGSGYLLCSPATHRGIVSQLHRTTGRPSFSLDYRMAPRFQFPAANEDTLRGYRWLLDQGFAGSDIIVAGDSAGGHLALALLGDLQRAGLEMPAGVVAFSPLVDGSLATAGGHQVRDPWFFKHTMRRVLRLYFGGADITDPRFDVRAGAIAGLPPILIQAGSRELLAADAAAFGTAMADAGGACEVQIWPGQVHVFQALYRFLPEARAAFAEVGRFVAELDGIAYTSPVVLRVESTG